MTAAKRLTRLEQRRRKLGMSLRIKGTSTRSQLLNATGRWARMPANILLKQNRSPIIEWPEEAVGTESTVRSEYIAAIKEADNGDDQPLLALHRRFLGS